MTNRERQLRDELEALLTWIDQNGAGQGALDRIKQYQTEIAWLQQHHASHHGGTHG